MNLSDGKSFMFEKIRNEGRVEGLAEVLLIVLDARGIAVTDGIREQIDTCYDLPLLRHWLTRAATATTAEEVFATDRCPTCGAVGQVAF
ncbi:hypothetical protein ACIOZL_12390 [Streptomyces sp. NPDC087769]|uniref:hypothetical protein n=1 Tax=unclassified Streptomyces TaxID=2593676 RepID=UPI00341F460B